MPFPADTVQRAGPVGEVPVVLVHAGVADRRMWDGIWPVLSQVRDVIRYDLRGFGQSSDSPTGMLNHVADLVDVLDSCGVEAAHLVGASFGAGVVVETALQHPARARSLVLCPVGGSLLSERTEDFAAFAAAEGAALDAGDLDAAVEANVDAWLVGPGRSRADVDERLVELVSAMQRRAFEVEASWGEVDQLDLQPPALERLEELSVPVLALVGRHDLETVHRATADVAARASGARRVDWPDVSHLPALEQPGRFVGLLEDWLSGA